MSIQVSKTSDQKTMAQIETDDYKAQLFPIPVKTQNESKAELAYNCSLYVKKSGINITFPIRKVTGGDKAGEFLAGDASRLKSHRALVTEFLKSGEVDEKGKAIGKVIEKTTVPYPLYADLMAKTKEADALIVAEAGA